MAADITLGCTTTWLVEGLRLGPENSQGSEAHVQLEVDDEPRGVDRGIVSADEHEPLLNSAHLATQDSSSNRSSIWQGLEGGSSSALLSLSPPRSPRLWRPDAAEPAQIPEGSGTPIDYIPLEKRKDRQGLVLAGNTDEAAAPVQRTPFQKRKELRSQGFGNSQQGHLHARSLFQQPTTPQKPHLQRKRAKFLPALSLHLPSEVVGGSLAGHIGSSSRQSLRFEGWVTEELSPGPPPLPSSQSPGGIQNSSMEMENDGDEWQQERDLSVYLTDDLLLKVFSNLDQANLCKAALVCRHWGAASAHEDFWKSLNFESRRVSNEQVMNVCNRYPRATELNLRNTSNVDEAHVRDAVRSLRSLEILALGRTFYTETFFSALTECALLRKLSISESVLGSVGAQEVQLKLEGLRSLELVKCRALRISIRCPQLEELSLNRTGTSSVLLICPRLTSLDLSSCHKLSDSGVRNAAVVCPLLVSLDVSNCAGVTDDTLREISLACTQLQALDASFCPNISLEGVRMPLLTELRLQSCEGINSSSMAAISHCIMLEMLVMDSCWLLTSVNLDLPKLRSISLAKNKKLMELTLRSPFLVSLDLNECPALNRIDLQSSSLPRLDLKQQSGLSSMALQCPRLQVVDLSECESLTDLVCNVFSDGGGCPKLHTLILDNCDGLVKVKLCNSSLETLSLVGCKKMTTLELSCPGLQRLQLDGCDRLIDASFAPVGLASLNLGICPHLTNLVIKAESMTVLELRGCGLLSQASINCPNLCSLDASYCSQFGDECLATTTSACPAIQQLVLASCIGVGPAGLLALTKLVDLTMLDVSYTFLTDLSPIFEACPRLKVLKLSACKYLDETSLDALHGGKKLPELQELDISYGSLGRKAIEGVLAHCPHLVRISLNGCANVTDHLWAHLSPPQSEAATSTDAMDTLPSTSSSARALQSLNCVGCQNIRSVCILPASCPHLSSINLSLSNNIREVNLACANLGSLILSNCAALSLLKLDCPRLTNLSLLGCGIEPKMLKAALEGCTMLETLHVRNCPKIRAVSLAPIRGLCPNIKRVY